MGKNGRLRRLIFTFHRSSSSSDSAAKPPLEFICPISNTLMFDPAVVSSGQTFERLVVQVCQDLDFTPTLPDGSSPEFSTVIPNLALKSAITSWCAKSGSDRPSPPMYSDIESTVCSMRRSSSASVSRSSHSPKIRSSERELLKGVSENPRVLFLHAASELNSRNLYSSSSSEESVIANTTPLLPFATRPSCYSNSSSPSTSSEFVAEEASSNYVSAAASTSSSPGEDENYAIKLMSSDIYEQEQAVILLRKTTKTSITARAELCSEKLLLALKNVLSSPYAVVQTNAAAALVNLSIERSNKVKIVRAGIVPLLIDVLRNGFEEAKEHAAGAIFSLAIANENRTAIGVIGALQPLMHALRSGSRSCRLDAALALYHLTLVSLNRVKIVQLGAVGVLLGLLRDVKVAARVVLVVCNLAACDTGRAALLDSGGIECLVDVLRSKTGLVSESTRDNCVAALHSLSLGSMYRFKILAQHAGADEVLREVIETGSERAREKARRILEGLRGREEANDGEEVDWEAVMKGGVGRMRYRVEANSTQV